MKKFLLLTLAALSFSGVSAEDKITVLDLTKADPKLEFNVETGAWSETYNDDAESIESQCFSFVHSSVADWKSWWGFTASNSADNSMREDFITYQFSNMAKGGIVLNEDGSVKLDEFGAPVVCADVPYIIGYYSPFMAARPVDMTFNDGKAHEVVGVYVNLTSYTYYSIQNGDAYARAFNNGDSFKLTIHGVASDDSEKTVEVELASYNNGNLTLNRGWSYVDLSPLGEVNELYFTMKSTDSGTYGDNTPEYFCLDKLMVKTAETSGIANIGTDAHAVVCYDRASKTVTVDGADFAAVYDVSGRQVMATDSSKFSLSSLPAGVYVIRAGASSIKIAK